MSQNSMVINDGSGAAVLAAINNALNTLVGLNSGTSAPTVTYPYMWWADTTSGLLKQRNAGDTAWVSKCALNSAFAAAGNNSDINSMTALTAPTVAANPMRATDLQAQTVTAFTTGGTSAAFTLTPIPAITALSTNQRFHVTFNAAAGTTPTLAISGLTAKLLKYKDTTGAKQAITSAQVPSGWVSDVEYDGTDYMVLSVAGSAVKGTTTNDNASAGYLGEYIESYAGPVSASASNTYGDITSISLTAGDWDISAIAVSILNTGTSITSVAAGIDNTAGNSGSGLVAGNTMGYSVPPTAQYAPTITIPPKRVSLASTTTYYLKMLMSYSGGTPQFQGRISARRVR